MHNAIEGRGGEEHIGVRIRGVYFFLRCKETWSPIIDGTCLLIMNLPGCYRLPSRKFRSKLSFPNYCFVKTLSQGLLCV